MKLSEQKLRFQGAAECFAKLKLLEMPEIIDTAQEQHYNLHKYNRLRNRLTRDKNRLPKAKAAILAIADMLFTPMI